MRLPLLLALVLAWPAAGLARNEPRTLVALRGRDEAGLRALLARQQDPASADFARWLTPAEFGRRFGASGRDLRRVSRLLRARGCRVRRFASRQLLSCAGPRVAVDLALEPPITDVIDPDEGPAVTTHLVVHPLSVVQGNFYVTPDEFARVYNLTPLRAAGIDGSGQR